MLDLFSLFAIAVGLAMDAFAVAIVTGLTVRPLSLAQVGRMSLSFGLFQAIMPLIGWFAGRAVHQYIASVDHWIAFLLLALVGGNMIWQAFRDDDGEGLQCNLSDPTCGWHLFALSLATSIDALAVGLTMAMIGAKILFPALVIGLVAFMFTAAGMVFGNKVGGKWSKWGKWVEVLGGVILVGIGLRIVAEHILLA